MSGWGCNIKDMDEEGKKEQEQQQEEKGRGGGRMEDEGEEGVQEDTMFKQTRHEQLCGVQASKPQEVHAQSGFVCTIGEQEKA